MATDGRSRLWLYGVAAGGAAAAGVAIAVVASRRRNQQGGGGSVTTAGQTTAQPVAIPVQPLGALQVGKAFAHQWTATGGSGTYAWTVSGSLPPGLALAQNGLMAGTPTQAGSFTFTVQAADATNPQVIARRSVAVTVAPAESTLAIPVQSLGTLQVGLAFSHQWAATGGVPPITWQAAGNVPQGLVLSTGGLMAGTPQAAGDYLFTVYATDSTGARVGRQTTVSVLPAAQVQAPQTSLGGPTSTPPGTVLYSSGGTPGTPGSTTITDLSGGTVGTSGSVDLQVTKTAPSGQTTTQVYNVQTNPSTGQTAINLRYSHVLPQPIFINPMTHLIHTTASTSSEAAPSASTSASTAKTTAKTTTTTSSTRTLVRHPYAVNATTGEAYIRL